MKHVYMRKTHVFWSSPRLFTTTSIPQSSLKSASFTYRIEPFNDDNELVVPLSGLLCAWEYFRQKNVRMDYRVVFSPSLSWSHTEAEEVRLLSTRKRERWYILRCLLTVLPSLSRSLCVCVCLCVYFSLHSRNAHNYVQRTKKIEPEITKR